AVGSRASFVKLMQDWLLKNGFEREEGGLTDITSESRLGLIFDTQTRQAEDFGYFKQGMDPDVLNEFPAQRFIRVREVKEERESHMQYQDQVYLKTDPIWALEINEDFGVPWGPWAWGCGHDVEDVDRDEAESLNLIQAGDTLEPVQKFFNENLQASVAKIDEDLLAKLQQAFGKQLLLDGNVLRWQPSGPETVPAPAPAAERQNPVSDAIQPA